MTNSLKAQHIVLESLHNEKKISVDVRYLENGQPKPIILFVHGFKGFKDWGHFNLIADHFALSKFVYIKLNLSHNGTTPDQPLDFADLEAFSNNNFSIELDDIGVVIDYLFSKDCVVPSSEMQRDDLFLMGHSRGGGLVLLKTAEDNRVKAAATWSAVGDFHRWTSAALNQWEQDGIMYILNGRTGQQMPLKYQLIEDLELNSERLDIKNKVKSIEQPLLIVHGTQDETVDKADAELIKANARDARLIYIEGGNHVLGGQHPYDKSALPAATKEAIHHTIAFFESIDHI